MGSVSVRSVVVAAAMLSATASSAVAQSNAIAAGGLAATQTTSNVNIVNAPTVTVGNTALQPIPVKEPPKEPVHANIALSITNELVAGFGTYSIPVGKRLVIEHESFFCHSPKPVEMLMIVEQGGDAASFMPAKSFAYLFGETASAAAGPLSAYFDGDVSVTLIRNVVGIGTTNCTVALAGYLTPLQ
jgi:hypothetical protein